MVRIAVLALRNLLSAPGLEYGPDMVEAGLPKVVQQRQLQARTPQLMQPIKFVHLLTRTLHTHCFAHAAPG